ncbi:MAG: hypothetical protein HY000_21850 [Planctomycetes bacterium]|nr:hypothetical protein [Planctomycetota bacterium]
MARARRGRSRGGVNKSQAIRDYMDNNPGAAPKDVAAVLQAQGIKVSSQLVSNVKTLMGKRAKRGRGGARVKTARRGATRSGRVGVAAISVQDLMDAKRVVEQVGSVEAVRKALDALESLRL